ncbi:MAG: hypothetical protein HOW73_39900 [Polyangiaceae bacterium]|nr:hypothetical protein [Polyangiaceae bacterium]
MNTGETGDRFFNVYVPRASASSTSSLNGSPQTATATTYESYFRVGGPDATTEASFLDTLRDDYAGADSEAAVRAAFGSSATGGVAFYTEGDLVQYVGGKSDTRVLNDSYVVHVLNKEDVDAAMAGDDRKTFRTYFRMGKPNADIEKPLRLNAEPDDLVEMIAGLEPPARDYGWFEMNLGGAKEAILSGDLVVRSLLANRADRGDTAAIAVLDELRVTDDPRGEDVYDGKTAKNWALATLQSIHLGAANYRRDKALTGDLTSRNILEQRAGAEDPVSIRKLVELAESRNPAAISEQNGQTPAREWAKSILDGLAPSELEARFSLGDGVALYSDKSVTLSTPETLKVTVGKDTRTVLGPTYSETYDVSDEVIQQIKDGWISGVSEITDKKLITASLTRRDAFGLSWRTTKFDLAKTLTFAASDNGAFTLGSAYTYSAGLKFGNSLGVSFDASTGASVSAPLSLKVELVANRVETAWALGKIAYGHKGSLKGGSSIEISVDPTTKGTLVALKPVSDVIRIGMGVINAAIAAYTAAFTAIGAATSADDDDGSTIDVKDMMETGEAVYLAAQALNTVLAVVCIVAGVVQIATEKVAKAAKDGSPVQPSNIVMNDAGIKLQVGTTYIHIGTTGILMSGTQIVTASPASQFVPQVAPGNMTPVGLLEIASLASDAGVSLPAWGL